MKKNVLLLLAALTVSGAFARETLNIVQGDVVYKYAGEYMGKAVFSTDGSFTLMNRTFKPSEVDRMYVDESEVTDNLVSVVYSGSKVSVEVAGNIAPYVTTTVSGGDVTIIQSDAVGDAVGEIAYRLSGSNDSGSFSLGGSYKASVELAGLDLKSNSGAALNIQNGKRIALRVVDGTVNSVEDAPGGSQKGAIVCKGHLEIKGKGTLNVTGKTAHAIQSKEYFEMKNATLNILGSVKDGINCAQYFLLESGTLNLTGIGDDAIQTDFKDTADRETEDTGSMTIAGGTLTATVSAAASKGLKAEGDITVSGGAIEIKTTGKGMWDADKSKTKASACLSADGNVVVSGGTLNLTSTGSGGKGISGDGTVTLKEGALTVATSGGVFAYVNGKEYDGYTGSTDRLNSDSKSSPKGIKADGAIVIDGGKIDVTTSGNGAEGIESKSTLTVNGGEIFVKAYDDAINSSSHMYINGGDITVIATNNDGLDSNGNLVFNGGTVRAFGASSPECGIDANDEQGYSVIFKGGTVLAVGGGNSVPSSSDSTQAYVSASSSAKANTEITLLDGDTVLAAFVVPAEYGSTSPRIAPGGREFRARPMFAPMFAPGGGPGGGPGGMGGGMLISCPGMTNGSSYTLRNGTSTMTVTATLRGSNSGRPW
ncbi:MAG: carbohydrate-binding domain-containing protein [Bacteroides sp.]|nr:carbohydrate-binding domain-containing protein [Bacteroides sp.]